MLPSYRLHHWRKSFFFLKKSAMAVHDHFWMSSRGHSQVYINQRYPRPFPLNRTILTTPNVSPRASSCKVSDANEARRGGGTINQEPQCTNRLNDAGYSSSWRRGFAYSIHGTYWSVRRLLPCCELLLNFILRVQRDLHCLRSELERNMPRNLKQPSTLSIDHALRLIGSQEEGYMACVVHPAFCLLSNVFLSRWPKEFGRRFRILRKGLTVSPKGSLLLFNVAVTVVIYKHLDLTRTYIFSKLWVLLIMYLSHIDPLR